MIKKQKKLCLIIFLATLFCGLGGSVFAQKNNGSPYSRFGLGDLVEKGSAHNTAMGNTGVALRGLSFLNAQNPASYTALDSISFLLDAGGSGEINMLESNGIKDNYSKINFNYISFGFSVKKWWAMALGLRKISNVSYGLEFNSSDDQLGDFQTKYSGNGGVNKVYWANAFKVNEFSFGADVNYNWGSIVNERVVDFASGQGLSYNSREELSVSSFNYDFGLQYEKDLNEKQNLVVGVTFGNKTDITGDYKYQSFVAGDTIQNEKKDKQVLNIPNNFGIGLALNNDNKLLYTVDFNYHSWEDSAGVYAQNRGDEDLVKLKDSYRICAGVEYTPNYMSARSYWDRINYRFGAYMGKTYLEVKGDQMKEYGLTFGMGFPLRGRSSIDVAFEFGARGMSQNDLVKERFARMKISFSLFEAWFRKMLYN